ncbi:MAG TPA: redox-regulated ATPase YchF [Candidatus Dojkabacteria bacterium]|nr:redox-regulated ATPase YchF [Candidatus Dojkabacteria bacterium]
MGVVRSHSLSIGIVGLPNAGKSSLFNSLTKNLVPAENFPFTTIDKNVGVVVVPDKRLESLNTFFSANKKVPSAITFVDIAGLVKGASKGEGLGNQFLSHIREVDVILYVLRAFKSENIVHVYNRVSPFEDLAIVQSELILKDVETIEKKLGELKKNSRSGMTPELSLGIGVLERAMEWMGEGKMVVNMPMNDEEKAFMQELWLLSNKKGMYLLNIREGMDEVEREEWVMAFKEQLPQEDRDYVVQGDVKMIGELSDMNEDEKAEYIALLDKTPVMMEDIIATAYKRLNLVTFYTGSEKEVNAWTVEAGASARDAAGVIHTDLAKGFITAEVVNVNRMLELGGWNKAKEAGAVKNVGKEYVIQDGDYMIVYSN